MILNHPARRSVNEGMKTLIRTVVAGAALATAISACTSAPGGTAPTKQRLPAVRLVSYNGCDDMLAGLREHAAGNVSQWGFGGAVPMYMTREKSATTADAAPEHSTTNTHEAGVDEPDLVKTDGNRVITVSGRHAADHRHGHQEGHRVRQAHQDRRARLRPRRPARLGDRALVLYSRGRHHVQDGRARRRDQIPARGPVR